MRRAVMLLLCAAFPACDDSGDGSASTLLEERLDLGGGVSYPAGQPPPEAAVAPASVFGFVYRVNPLVIVDDPSHAPAGGTPVPGADVRVIDLFGGAGTTGPDGRFEIEDLPLGLLRAEVRSAPGLPDPEVAPEFTAIAGTAIPLGAPYPVTRAAAAQTALAGVTPTALVAGTMQPLPAGTVIAERGAPPSDALRARRLAADEYFFFVDLEPTGKYGHPTEFVFVDAQTGAVSRLGGLAGPPRANGENLWGSDLDLFRFLNFNFKTAAPDAPFPDPVDVEETAEVVQLPTGGLPLSTEPQLAGPTPFPQGPGGVFAIVVRCGKGTSERADSLKMVKWLAAQGVPSPNVWWVRAPDFMRIQDALLDYNTGFSLIQDEIRTRLDNGLASTLIVYLTGHQYVAEDGSGLPSGEMSWELQSRDFDITPSALHIETSLACKVRVIIDTCFAEHYGKLIAERFEALPPEDRADLIVLCSSMEDEKSLQIPLAVSFFLTLTIADVGSRFTKRIVDNGKIENGDFSNALDASGQQINEDLDPIGQDAVAIIRPNTPDRCVGLSPTAYLVLAHDLSLTLRAGMEIPLHEIQGGTVADPDACGETHLHGTVTIRGQGPFTDHDPGACGHGVIRGG